MKDRPFTVTARRSFLRRPTIVDCRLCAGRGRAFNLFRQENTHRHCSTCVGTGLEPTPWSELFRGARVRK